MIRIIAIKKGYYFPKQYYLINVHNGNVMCELGREKLMPLCYVNRQPPSVQCIKRSYKLDNARCHIVPLNYI